MGFRAGLIGLGIGASFIGGGAWALEEGFSDLHAESQDRACLQTQRHLGQTACHNAVINEETLKAESNEAKTLLTIGGISMIGGTLGTLFSFIEIIKSDDLADRTKV